MNRTVIVFLVMALTACAPHPPPSALGPNGRPAYTLECLDQEKNCEEQARKLCPKGYAVSDKSYRGIVAWRGFTAEHTVKYNLTIECSK